MSDVVQSVEPTELDKLMAQLAGFNQEQSKLAQEAGVMAYNVYWYQGEISDRQVKMRNLTLDINKTQAAIQKIKADEAAQNVIHAVPSEQSNVVQ